ncbi:astacin, partial [Teladorsagia circumcincta]
MKRIAKNTCVRFKEWEGEIDYIDLVNKQEFHDQFAKVSPFEATTYNVPYDYKSVMHYGKDAFALPNKISMRTKDPDYQ